MLTQHAMLQFAWNVAVQERALHHDKMSRGHGGSGSILLIF